MTGSGFWVASNKLKMCVFATNSNNKIYAIVFLYKMSCVDHSKYGLLGILSSLQRFIIYTVIIKTDCINYLILLTIYFPLKVNQNFDPG